MPLIPFFMSGSGKGSPPAPASGLTTMSIIGLDKAVGAGRTLPLRGLLRQPPKIAGVIANRIDCATGLGRPIAVTPRLGGEVRGT